MGQITELTASTRRNFIGGVTALAAAGSPTVASIAAQSETATTQEAGESKVLSQLGTELAAAQTRYQNSLEAIDTARAVALKLAPAIPEGLPVPFSISVFGQISWYSLPEPTDILGNRIELPRFISPRNGKSFPVRVPTTEDILSDRQSGRRWNHGHLPAWQKGEHRRLYDLAVQFERATEDALEASGLNDADWERYRALDDLIKICVSIAKAKAETPGDLLIKARAIQACPDQPTAAWASALLPAAIVEVMGG